MIDRDQKIKITHSPAATYRKAPQFRADIMARALSVKKKSATPWMMLTSVSSMFITVESSSRRLSLGGFTDATGNRSASGMSSCGRDFTRIRRPRLLFGRSFTTQELGKKLLQFSTSNL